ncbi:helix-turn-helix transcriptional regulator [Promicromonospora sp. Marseille-Q5078]
MVSHERINELGPAVRRWRERVAPEAAGVTVGSRRRAKGLRREELADLAGISMDYLTRLEQGRATSPSAQVTEALARALRLSDPERELLFRLGGLPVPDAGAVPSRIPPSVQRLLDRLAGNPVAVYDATWTLVVANTPYDALLGATTAWRGIERNALWRHLVGPASRVVHTAEEHADLVAGLVGDLRLTTARYPSDPRVQRLVDELGARSPRFVELWESAPIVRREDPSRHKVVEHPSVGRIAVDCDTLVVAGDDLRIMVYSAEPGSEDADRLALAVVLGTQSLVG